MAQEFMYPNLISGTRGTGCYTETWGQQQDDSQPWDLHNASQTQENSMLLQGIPVKPDTDYTLTAWVDRTDNMKSSDIYILDTTGGYVPLWYELDFQTPAGGGIRLVDVPLLVRAEQKHEVRHPIRQQRLEGRKRLCLARARRHAHGGHRATRMGTSGWGGVAVDER